MKKLFVLLVGMMTLFVQQGFSQLRLTENFNTVPPLGWAAVQNGSYWQADMTYHTSAGQSCNGMVPSMLGSETVLETRSYNLAGLPYVLLRFNHICKIAPSDTVRIEIGYYKGPGIYGDWKPLPSSSSVYKGAATNYGTTGFNAASYTIWDAANNLTLPNNSTWWKPEEFDLRTDAGQQDVKFRFVIKRGNVSGTNAAYGWLIDDFEVLASTVPIIPPTVELVSPFVKDTVYSTGPWEIRAKVKSNTSVPIAVPWLKWTTSTGVTDSIQMTKVDTVLWKANIPQYPAGTSVSYSITGKDTITNTLNTATALSGYYIKMMCGGSGTPGTTVYGYTGSAQPVQLYAGIYEIEMWGADGHATTANYQGRGGYSKGTLTVNSNAIYYLYVGGKGSYPTSGVVANTWTFNGGGVGYPNSSASYGNGGGATDLRTIGGNWDDVPGLQSRLIVAGGGGAGRDATYIGGNGGGQTGGTGTYFSPDQTGGPTGGTQSAGGQNAGYVSGLTAATLGKAMTWDGATLTATFLAGGGGGYYGGGSGRVAGGGGSGYVGGVASGVTAQYNASGFVASPVSTGDGYAKITLITSLGSCDTNSVALHSIDMLDTIPTAPTANDSILVTVKNKGVADLDSVWVSYTINGLNRKDTLIKFTSDPLKWDMNRQVVAGYYNFPSNVTVLLTAWVSYPNGQLDSVLTDDTIKNKKIYGSTDIHVQWNNIPEDTIHYTGPIAVTAKIISLTNKPLNNIKLYFKAAPGNIFDSVVMTTQGGGIFEAEIPHIRFESKVEYWIQLTDYLGNNIRLDSNYYIQKICDWVGGPSSGNNQPSPASVHPYTGSVVTRTLDPGTYEIEVWGANGGNAAYPSGPYTWFGGAGGYSKGTLTLSVATTLNIYVGGVGQTKPTNSTSIATGGWNGGGNGGSSSSSSYYEIGGGGGGATDIRINGTATSNRIIVAGGGGGAGYGEHVTNTYAGGKGGGLSGTTAPFYPSYAARVGGAGTQLSAGAGGTNGTTTAGVAGVGAVGGAGANGAAGGGGGGGGWYGGGSGTDGSGCSGGGGGGSGYIGGVTNGITDTLGGLKFVANPDASSGNGYVKITPVGGSSGGGSGSGGGSAVAGTPQDYTYQGSGSTETVNLPAGTYQLECWGANGGSNSNAASTFGFSGGKGGYSKGTITLAAPTTLYVSVGGTTTTNAGGWNGGGTVNQTTENRGGGGATHIATASGLLPSFSSNQGAVMIVAGGGGGNGWYSSGPNSGQGGNGGGLNGGGGTTNYATYNGGGGGGTQLAGGINLNNSGSGTEGTFGQGGTFGSSNAGGGGGGWYGGASGFAFGAAGGGGSGYIGNPSITNGLTAQLTDPGFVPNPTTNGNGHVRITPMKVGSNGPSGVHGNCKDSNSVALETILEPAKDTLNVGTVAVKVRLRNVGIKDLKTCLLNFSVNGITQLTMPRTYTHTGLPEDFTDTITVGYYSIKGGDNLFTVWVSSPNGVIDSVTSDDTLDKKVYVKTDLIVKLISGPMDTVYSTGPYTVKIKVYSLSGVTSIRNPLYLHYDRIETEGSGLLIRDSVILQYTSDDIYEAEIPKIIYESDVVYYLSHFDYAGIPNEVVGHYYIARPDCGSGSSGDFIVGVPVNYPFTGGEYSVDLPAGEYEIELWGANGGDVTYGGKGGYSKGTYTISAATTVYVCVGGAGSTTLGNNVPGGYNGGGMQAYANNGTLGTGGGATHLSTASGLLSNAAVRDNIIIVAGGGGGAGYSNTTGGNGGGITGGNAVSVSYATYCIGQGGTQTAGGAVNGTVAGSNSSSATAGTAGVGGAGVGNSGGGGGGGGGWYGGSGGNINGGGGGSGYIDGVTDGVTAQLGTLGFVANPVTSGDGYAKITLLRAAGRLCIDSSVAMDAILAPGKLGIVGIPQPITARIRNVGDSPLKTCRVGWMLDGVQQNWVTYTSTYPNGLPSDFTDTITIGNYPYLVGDHQIAVWVSMPNGILDGELKDDTLKRTVEGCNPSTVFEIGQGRDYATVALAIKALRNCGVNGNTVFELKGTITESIDLGSLDYMQGYHLTITSVGNHADSAVLRPISGMGISMGAVKDLTIQGITIDVSALNTTAINFTGACTNILVRDCKLLGDPNTTTSGVNIINKAANTGTAEKVSFIKNIIDGGYNGIYFYGGTGTTTSAIYGVDFVLDSNTITNQYSNATYLYNINFASYSYNTVISRLVTTTWYGIHAYYSAGNIIGNRAIYRGTSTSTVYPLYTYYHNYLGYGGAPYISRALIANNEIISSGTGTNNGMYHTYTNADIYHNSIYTYGTSGTQYGVYIGSTCDLNIKNNNIVLNSASGFPIRHTSGTFTSDGNNLYSPINVGYINNATTITDMATWKSSVTSDKSSVRIIPSFTDPANSLKMSSLTGMTTTPLNMVTEDIELTPRALLATMGCYEMMSTAPLNAALTAIYGLREGKISGQTDAVSVDVTNTGMSTGISSIDISWSVDGVLQGNVSQSVSLPYTGQTETISLGTITYPNANADVKVWINSVNGITDGNQKDDTIAKKVMICLLYPAGTYIVGSGSGAHFSSVQEAINAFVCGGMGGDITLELQTNTYTTALDFTNFSAYPYTLTVTSQTGNKDDVKIQPTSGTQTVTLNNTHNIVLENITIGRYATAPTYVIGFATATSSNITVRGCNLLMDTTSNATTYRIVNMPTGMVVCDGFYYTNNYSKGGGYGMYLYGWSNVVGRLTTNIVIEDNIFDGLAYDGINATYTYIKSISRNTFYTKTANTSTTRFEGMYLSSAHVDEIVGNRIIQRSSSSLTGYAHGIYMTSVNTVLLPDRKPTIIANNEIILYGSGATTVSSGIYMDAYGNASYPATQILNNSVFLRNQTTTGVTCGTATTYGIYVNLSGTTTKFVLKNNIFHTANTSTTAAYPIYLATTYTAANHTVDANNMYGTSNVGYVNSAARADLTAWRSVFTADVTSQKILPSYINSATNLKLSSYTNMISTRDPLVVVDVDGNARAATTSWGCYHDPSVAATPFADGALSNVKGSGFNPREAYVGRQDMLTVDLTNTGQSTITSAQICWTENGTSKPNAQWTGTLLPGQTTSITFGPFTYQGFTNTVTATLCNLGTLTDTDPSNNTASASTHICGGPLASGTYNIPGHFATLKAFVDKIDSCGANGDITLILSGTITETETVDLTNFPIKLNGGKLTITSSGNNPANATVQLANGTAGILLNKSNNLTISAITLTGVTTATHPMYLIQFTGACTNVLVRDCKILGNPTSTSTTNSYYLVYKGSSTGIDNNISFIHNEMDGGYNGVYFYGGIGTGAGQYGTLVLDSNTITNQYNYATYFYYVNFNSFAYNTIKSRTSTTTWYGTYLYNVNADILNNRILYQGTSSTVNLIYVGAYLNYSTYGGNPSGKRALIANNEFISYGTGTQNGINGYQYTIADIVNNSIYFSSTSGTQYAIYLYAYSDVNLRNNNIVMRTTGTAYFVCEGSTSYTQTVTSANNNLYSTPTNVAYRVISSAFQTLTWATWQSTHSDYTSVRTLPTYVDAATNKTHLQLTSNSGYTCPRNASVLNDIRGYVRGATTTMGCYANEGTAPVIALNAALSNLSPLKQGNIPLITEMLSVKVSNTGTGTVNTLDLNWSVNTVSKGIIPLAAPLAPGESVVVNLGPITYTPGNIALKVWINSANGGKDSNQGDDTIKASAYIYNCSGPLSGSYTVGNGKNFPDIESALKKIDSCGVSGDIRLLLASGTYAQNWNFLNQTFNSGVNYGTAMGGYTLTFASEANDRNMVKIEPASGNAVTLSGMRNLAFEEITFGRYTTNHTYAVQIAAACENITFRNCNLLCDTVSTSSTYYPLYKASSTPVGNFRMVGCLLDGGYYSASFYGGSANNQSATGRNIAFDSNTFRNGYIYGLYLYQGVYTSVSNNTFISRAANNTSYWHGLYFSTGCHVEDVISNHIIQQKTPTTAYTYHYGIYFGSSNNTTVIAGRKPTRVLNNEIIASCVGGSTSYGICLSSTGKETDYMPIYVLNNSIYFPATTSIGGTPSTNPTYGICVTSVPAGQLNVVKNNNIYIEANQTPNNYPIYLGTTFDSKLFDVDYNNMYALQNVGYANGAARANIAAWQSVVTSDNNSISILPTFTRPIDNLKMNVVIPFPFLAPRNAANGNDIDGKVRPAITTMGAYECATQGTDLAALQLLPAGQKVVNGQTLSLSVDVLNIGTDAANDAIFRYSVNGQVSSAVPRNLALATFEQRNIPIDAIQVSGAVGTKINVLVWIDSVNAQPSTVKWNDTASMVYIISPLVEFISPLVDDTIGTATFDVYANILDVTGAPVSKPPYLVYHAVLGDCWELLDSVPMTPQGNGKWSATVPPPLYYGSTVTYWIHVEDAIGNKSDIKDSTYVLYGALSADVINIPYSGNVYPLLLKRGTYEIECWGADGGTGNSYSGAGGKGGYSKGTYTVKSPTTVYVYVGGTPPVAGTAAILGGWNGGGGREINTQTSYHSGAGGGGTDVRLTQNTTYADRIIVAGGGGGGGNTAGGGTVQLLVGGNGGGATGQAGGVQTGAGGGGGTQSAGGAGGYYTSQSYLGGAGTLGQGGEGKTYTTSTYYPGGGGGGGYYGGGGGSISAGGGGSGYIGGVTSGVTAQYTEQSFVANPDVSGNGYVRITPLGGGSEVYPNNHLSIISVESPQNTTGFDCIASDSVDVTIQLANIGSVNYNFASDNIDLMCEVIDPTGKLHSSYIPVRTGKLESGDVDVYTAMKNLPVPYPGRYIIKAWVNAPKDIFHCDDTITYVYVSSKISLPIDEDFTAATMPLEFVTLPDVGTLKWELCQLDTNVMKSNPSSIDRGTAAIKFEGEYGGVAYLNTRMFDLYNVQNPLLEFWYYHDTNTSVRDNTSLEVYIKVDGVSEPKLKIFKRQKTGVVHGWNYYSVPLNAYTNSHCVQVQFYAMSLHLDLVPSAQYIDRVVIDAYKDLALTEVILPTLQACDFNSKEIKVVMHNPSTLGIDFSRMPTSINLRVNSQDIVVAKDAGMILPMGYDTVVVTTMNFVQGTTYDFRAWIADPIDNNPWNDTTARGASVIIIDPDVAIALRKETTTGCLPIGFPVNQMDTVYNRSQNFDLFNIPIWVEVQDDNGSTVKYMYDTIPYIPKNSFVVHKFDTSYSVPKVSSGVYTVIANAVLACDYKTTNNENIPIQECADIHDIDVVEVLTPSGSDCDIRGDSVHIVARLVNLDPYYPFSAVKIRAIISDGQLLQETIASIPASKQPFDYKFVAPYIVPTAANYTITVFVEGADANTANDTASANRCTGTSVPNFDKTSFALGQNVPNPAKENTRIDYNVPQDGQVVFTVYTITGQALFVEKRDARSGKNEFEFSTENLANGIYYYSVEYKGERLVKKMTIRK